MRASKMSSAATPATVSPKPRREVCVVSAPPVVPQAEWAELAEPTRARRIARLFSRIGTFCLVELQKLRHDRSELITRAIQPVLWLVVFGKTFSQIRAIP